MGPIPAEDMEKWLLHGVPPKQMGRAIHRPVLEATSADPASLLVCALLPGELERNMKPGARYVLQAPYAALHCRSRSPSLPNILGSALCVWNAAHYINDACCNQPPYMFVLLQARMPLCPSGNLCMASAWAWTTPASQKV